MNTSWLFICSGIFLKPTFNFVNQRTQGGKDKKQAA